MNFIKISDDDKREIFRRTQAALELSQQIIEKDWWVTTVLRALFALPYAENLSFKGGTSLSKCWDLIERFSEDIDIAIDREYLGFGGVLSKTQISDKLRRASCSFVREKLQYDLKEQLINLGINSVDFSIKVNITPMSTTDPEIIEVEYHSLFDDIVYIKHKVIMEVSGRSMSEPIQKIELHSMIDEVFPDSPFSDSAFSIRAVIPQRTFLEKICLLHEEFAKSQEFIRIDRMSRHLYDLEQIMRTSIAEEALSDSRLYQSVIEHRRMFIGLKEFDYDTLAPLFINIIPPTNIIELWRYDYEQMQETMIYGESLPFDRLIEQIKILNQRIKELDISIG